MDYLPIFIDIRGQLCLLVGGGTVAARKSLALARAGARLRVVSPTIVEALKHEVSAGRVEWISREFEPSDVDEATLVVAACDDESINEAVSITCKAKRIPVNVVDRQALCSFIMPSIVDRSPLVIAISSAGKAPILARVLRARLESTIPAAMGILASLAGEFRARVKQRFEAMGARRAFWENILDGKAAELAYAGRTEAARRLIESELSAGNAPDTNGEVYLVGAGPGDPDLLTFRALRLMQRADVVLHDRLVSDAVLDLVRRDAERIYVGKERGSHTLKQNAINQTLVEQARKGLKVLRLKGGDPFIFGRGGEEIDTLSAEGIPFQVVPGITAASGCAAFAGIPITHRDHAQACVFVTGHLKDGTVDLNWPMLAQPRQTLVFYMGLTGLPVIARQLVAHGLSADTPAALIEHGTMPDQRVLEGTLATLPSLVKAELPRPPTLLIVGTVVSLRNKLAWYRPDAVLSAAVEYPPPYSGCLFTRT